MIATSGFVTALERTKFVFGRGSAPDPAGGAYCASPDPLASLKGPTSEGEGEGGKGEKRGKGKGRGEEGREEEGRAPFRKFLDSLLTASAGNLRLRSIFSSSCNLYFVVTSCLLRHQATGSAASVVP